MARGPSRSQLPSTQTRRLYDDDDDEENAEGIMEAAIQLNEAIERKARDLVRLLLFNEQRRAPTRRDEISKKVLGSGSRNFVIVFNQAQLILRQTFGMEIVELKSRSTGTAAEPESAQAKELEGMGLKKKGTSGPKSYILRSTLPPHLISQASTLSAFQDILALERTETMPLPSSKGKVEYDHAEEDSAGGSIFAWGKADQMGVVGVLYVVLALVLVSGRVISEGELQAHLKRLHLPPTSSLSLNASHFPSSLPTSTPPTLLSQFIKQGYLERTSIGATGTKGPSGGAGKKRGRVPALTQPSSTQAGSGGGQGGGNDEYEWRWGPRAHAEVGEKDIGRFVSEFIVDMSLGEEGEDNEEARKRMRGGVMRGVERAAGAGAAGALEEETKVE